MLYQTDVAARSMASDQSDVSEELRSRGYVLVRGADITSPEAFERSLSQVFPTGQLVSYEGEIATPRTKIASKVYTSTEYDSSSSIFIHNELSTRMSWPLNIFFSCNLPAEKGGATPLCDIRKVTRAIPDHISDKFSNLGICYMRNYGADFGVDLEYSFGTNDRRKIEEYCDSNEIECEWIGPEHLRTYARRPAYVLHPVTHERLWFNSAAFYSLSALERRQRLMMRGVPVVDRAFSTFFGDRGEIPEPIFEELVEIYRAATFRFEWQQGDLLLLDNMLMGHGRDPYEGERRIWVLMSDEVRRRSTLEEVVELVGGKDS